MPPIMNRFKVTEVNAILIFLIVNFVTLGFVIAIINYNSQVANQQREQTLELAAAIHKSESIISNKTDSLIMEHVKQDSLIHKQQSAILKNQAMILNTSQQNNRNLQAIYNASSLVNGIEARQKNTTAEVFKLNEKLNLLLNKTK